MLTKKLQQENAAEYESQLQKTYMFFHNPLWVEQLLNDTGSSIIKQAPEKKEQLATPEPVAETPILQEEQVLQAIITPVDEITSASPPEPAISVETEIVNIPVLTEASHQQPVEETMAVQVSENTEGVSAIELAESVFDNPSPITVVAPELPEIDNISAGKEEEKPTVESLPVVQAISVPPPAHAPESTELAFEPFHTVDYFASQGIKLKEEAKPKDKFGQQLKSFTDWLKTMKRLPAGEVAAITGQGSEKKVVQLAEHSLEEKEIITEAMAEVWEKQGNAAKAIAIYTKLSLLEPAKSPYFAAKIEELKKSN